MAKFVFSLLKGLGLLLTLVTLLMVAGVIWPLSKPEPKVRPHSLIIENVSVVDTETGELVPNQMIRVEGDNITAVAAQLQRDAEVVIDGSGKYAIPGLFDMHTHSFKLSPEVMHPLFIANGVTSVRDMGGCLDDDDSWAACAADKRAWTRGTIEGRHVGPRYDHITGLQINGGLAVPDGVDQGLGGATPDGARARVAMDQKRGLDFLKTYSMLPKDSYFALADEAEKRGLYLAGHIPLAVKATEAVVAGQRSFEHALVFLFDCYPGIQAMRELPDFLQKYDNELRTTMMREHDPEMCQNLFVMMKEAGTAFVPTHTTRKLDALATDEAFRTDARLKFVPAPLRMLWANDADAMAKRAEGTDSFSQVYEFGLRQTGAAHTAGVTVLAGTDAPDSFTFAGFSLADEMEHLVEAGLTPFEALQSATLHPAEFLGLTGKAGVLKAGARADIVLLNSNPLESAEAIRTIDTVVLAGTPYDRQSLDSMLADVQSSANSWSMWPKFAWQIARSPIMLKQFAD